MAFESIPFEIRQFDQWVVWRYEDTASSKPTKVPYSANSGRLAAVDDPRTWCKYEHALEALKTGHYSGLGFVLAESDPFAFIDLDDPWQLNADGSNKFPDPQQIMDRQIEIYNEFSSYAERSPSGKGLHIICKGSIEGGRKRGSIEVYSNLRFMTMTGDVYRNAPISNCQAALTVLHGRMGRGNEAAAFYAGVTQQKDSDEEIYNKAIAAKNGEKFHDLWHGNWRNHYETQSEADFALFDIIAFYTQHRPQIVRMFHISELGKREKAQRKDYINYMLNKCFDRLLPPVDLDGLKNQIEELISKKREDETKPAVSENSSFVKEQGNPEIKIENKDVYSVPPGLVGEIAQFIYAQAPQPIAVIALAGALGLMAGIVGRSYNISGTGLNQYILVLAGSGMGKEAIAKGIDKLMTQVVRTVPAAGEFIGPGEIASAAAVVKYMSAGRNSFVSIAGEFGIALQQMASPYAPTNLVGLKRFMLDVYNKSGHGQTLKPMIYSDKANNTNAIYSPAFTLLGESTPEKFYEGLHEGVVNEGSLSRFELFEYFGLIPPLNKNSYLVKPTFELIEKLATMCANSLMLNSQNKVIDVQLTPDAEKTLDQFQEYCRNQANKADRDLKRHLWTRSHIKALKMAATVAVGCNPYDPVIDEVIANWALNLVTNDTQNMLTRFANGEVGQDNDESKQLHEVVRCIKDFLTKSWPEVEKYSGEGTGQLHANKILPYSYLQRRLAAVLLFRRDKLGGSGAIKRALKTLCERGDIEELGKMVMARDYGCKATAFSISNPAALLK
jgi:hypothetical protein